MRALPEMRRAPGKAPLKKQTTHPTKRITDHADIANAEHAAIDWEVKIGESVDVAPSLDPDGQFFTVTKDDRLIRIVHSAEHPGCYVIHSCNVLRDQAGEITGIEEEEEVLRPLKAHAVGFFLEQFGCSRADTWLRFPRVTAA